MQLVSYLSNGEWLVVKRSMKLTLKTAFWGKSLTKGIQNRRKDWDYIVWHKIRIAQAWLPVRFTLLITKSFLIDLIIFLCAPDQQPTFYCEFYGPWIVFHSSRSIQSWMHGFWSSWGTRERGKILACPPWSPSQSRTHMCDGSGDYG